VSWVFLYGVIAATLAGLGTTLGALPGIFFRNIPHKWLDAMLGLAAGVMLAATSFSLVAPGIEYGSEMFGAVPGVLVVCAGIALGAIALNLCDRFLPHHHFEMGHEGPASSLRKTWLFVIAITIHNFPEGMAVGVGFGTGDIGAGTALAIGIGIQNMPEGLAVMLPLLREGYSVGKALLIASLSGLVEAVGGAVGAGLAVISQPALPWALAFAAGAMLFVISDEIIPETHHNKEHARLATFALVLGFIIMMALDNLLG
jgi:ZIP family zinc transporter